MVINIKNQSGKNRVVTSIDQGSIKSYPLEVDQVVQFECHEDMAELECDGTVLLVPTVLESVNYTLIEDKEIIRSRQQADVLYVFILVAICAITILTLKSTSLLVLAVFLMIEVLIITGMYKVLKSEQRGETVFIER